MIACIPGNLYCGLVVQFLLGSLYQSLSQHLNSLLCLLIQRQKDLKGARWVYFQFSELLLWLLVEAFLPLELSSEDQWSMVSQSSYFAGESLGVTVSGIIPISPWFLYLWILIMGKTCIEHWLKPYSYFWRTLLQSCRVLPSSCN